MALGSYQQVDLSIVFINFCALGEQSETALLQQKGPFWRRVPFVAAMLLLGYLAAAFNPACSARAAALSVASQVNSGSVRPKWPYAAVFW